MKTFFKDAAFIGGATLVIGSVILFLLSLFGCAHTASPARASSPSPVCVRPSTNVVYGSCDQRRTTEPDGSHYSCVFCSPSPVIGCFDPVNLAYCVSPATGCGDERCK